MMVIRVLLWVLVPKRAVRCGDGKSRGELFALL